MRRVREAHGSTWASVSNDLLERMLRAMRVMFYQELMAAQGHRQAAPPTPHNPGSVFQRTRATRAEETRITKLRGARVLAWPSGQRHSVLHPLLYDAGEGRASNGAIQMPIAPLQCSCAKGTVRDWRFHAL
jgi:hypothetical protein